MHVTARRPARACPTGTRTEAGLRHNIRVGVQYLEAWLRGNGCVPLYNLMEDAATAEISRAQVWQWLHHGAHARRRPAAHRRALPRASLDEELATLRASARAARFDARPLRRGARASSSACRTSADFDEFLTLPAYDELVELIGTRPRRDAGGTTMPTPRRADPPPADLTHDVPDGRWDGIERPYAPADVERLRGSVRIEHTLARLGARAAVGAAPHRAVRPRARRAHRQPGGAEVRAGLKAIYLSGWQVAADANDAGADVPRPEPLPGRQRPERGATHQPRAPARRPDRARRGQGTSRDWFAPIVADAEAGFGGPLNAFELMKAMIEAGAAGVHFEDQLASEKKCGHMGGKVLVPTGQFIRTLVAARLAADVMGVPTLLVARTDADSAKLLTRDVDARDRAFIVKGERTAEGFFRAQRRARVRDRARPAPTRPTPTCSGARPRRPTSTRRSEFAEGVHAKFPGKLLAYNCSPSFNWKKNLDDATIAKFQRELGAMGYKFQFVTLAGFHALNHGMFELARGYQRRAAWRPTRELQQAEFAAEAQRLHRHAAPARGRHRLLRRGRPGRLRRHGVDARAQGVHGGGAVLSAPAGRLT